MKINLFASVLSALFSFAGWLVRSIIVKFFLYFALYFMTTEFIEVLLPLLPGAARLTEAFSQQAPGVWYFLDLFKVGLGVSLVLSALVTRFIIRRVPILG
jgi:hypothetical protein